MKSKLCTKKTVFTALGIKMWDKCGHIHRNANITISRYRTKAFKVRSKTDATWSEQKINEMRNYTKDVKSQPAHP